MKLYILFVKENGVRVEGIFLSQGSASSYMTSKHLSAWIEEHELNEDYRHYLLSLPSDEERHDAIAELTEGICQHCGKVETKYRCHCWNDE